MGDKNFEPSKSVQPLRQPSESLDWLPINPEVAQKIQDDFKAMMSICPERIRSVCTILSPELRQAHSAAPIPIWAERASKRFLERIFPTVNPEKLGPNVMDPVSEARLIGHLAALINYVREKEGREQARGADQLSVFQQGAGVFLIFIAPIIESHVGEQLRLPREEAGTFFREFSFAFDRSFSKAGEVGAFSPATIIHVVISFAWPEISRLQNLEQFHGWLEQNLGHSMAGSLVRIKKICQELGLRFAGRGRPKKKDTSQNRAIPISSESHRVSLRRDNERKHERTADQAGALQKRSGSGSRRKPGHA